MKIIEIIPSAEDYLERKDSEKNRKRELVTNIVHIIAIIFICGFAVGRLFG